MSGALLKLLIGEEHRRGPARARSVDEVGTTEADVALRYLLNKHFVMEGEASAEFRITVMGIDRVREVRGLG